ncbi:MAG: biotin/lipoyl-binding protein [Pyrinomonadaceae bacterium]
MNEQAEEKASKKETPGNKEIDHSVSATDKNEDLSAASEEVPTEKEAEAETAESDENKPKKPRSKLPFVIIGAIVLIGAIGGLIYWLNARHYESTDDAFIDGDIVQISPKVSAYVKKVYVKGNQRVKKGDLLVELNTQDYEAKLAQARAQFRAAQAQKNQSQAQVALTRATTNASQTQAQSSVAAAQNNVDSSAPPPMQKNRKSVRRKMP